jgi:hypothetical protein
MPLLYKNGTAEYTVHRIVAKLKLKFPNEKSDDLSIVLPITTSLRFFIQF